MRGFLRAAMSMGARFGAPPMETRWRMLRTYAESLYSELELGWAPLHAWRTRGFKFIKAPHPELYDLENGSVSEKRIAPGSNGSAGQRFEQPARSGAASSDAVGPGTIGRCRNRRAAARARLCEWRTRVTRPRARRSAIPKTAFVFCRASIAACPRRASEPELAIRELTAVLEEDPGLFMARRTRAVAYAAAGRHELAIADLRVLDKEGQLTPEDAVVLGDNLRSAGRLEEAALILQRAERENPSFPQPLISLAAVRIQERKVR